MIPLLERERLFVLCEFLVPLSDEDVSLSNASGKSMKILGMLMFSLANRKGESLKMSKLGMLFSKKSKFLPFCFAKGNM